MMQGGAAISLDLPPYCIATGDNLLCGLNTVGLRRAGIPSGQRLELRQLYQTLFRRQGLLKSAIAKVDSGGLSEPARRLFDFVTGSKRGVCSHGRGRAVTGADDTD